MPWAMSSQEGVVPRGVRLVKMPEVVKTLHGAVIDPVGAGPAEYGQVIVREVEQMARAGKAAELKSE